FFIVRRPPNPPLFPYNDALPILGARRGQGGIGRRLVGRGRRGDAAAAARPAGLLLRRIHRAAAFELAQRLVEAVARVQFAQLARSEEHTSELQSRENLVCRLLLE